MHMSAIVPAPSDSDTFAPEFVPAPGIGVAFARYDLTAISADEIDDLVDSLKKLGLKDTPFLLELETRGSRFRSQIASNLNGLGITREVKIDNSEKINLIEVVEKQIEMAKHKGNKTAFTERYLEKLEYYLEAYGSARARFERMQRRNMHRNPQRRMPLK